MLSHVIAVTVDCRDAVAPARFWSRALGCVDIRPWDDGHGTVYVEIYDSVPVLLFQLVGARTVRAPRERFPRIAGDGR